MSEVIVYIAPSSRGSIEAQAEWAKTVASGDRFIRIDQPRLKSGPIDRTERDFVFGHMLRSGAANPDGKPDVLWVYSLDVLDTDHRQIHRLFKAMLTLEIPLYSYLDKLDPSTGGAEFAVRYADALKRTQRQGKRLESRSQPRKYVRHTTGKMGRPAALKPKHRAEMLILREEHMLTWKEISAQFAERGVRVGESTLRRIYAEIKGEE
jgi:hypothetical protein